MEISVSLNSVNGVKSLIGLTQSLDCDVEVRSGNYVVDGKSIMGLFSLDLSTPVIVVLKTDDKAVLDKFKVDVSSLDA